MIYALFVVEDLNHDDNPLLFLAMIPGILTAYITMVFVTTFNTPTDTSSSWDWLPYFMMFLVQIIIFSFLGFLLYLVHRAVARLLHRHR